MKIKNEILIPEGVKIEKEGNFVIVSGKNGKVKRFVPVDFKIEDNKVIVNDSKKNDKKQKKYINTTIAIIKSCIKGVTEGFEKKLQIVYAHFPVSFEVKGNELLIKNFLGEKLPRRARIVGDTKVKIEKDKIIVSGIDAYDVGQTAANIKQATKIKDKDPRVFQDGFYFVREE